MIVLTEKCRVHGFWLLGCERFDRLAVVIRPEPGKPWEALYRWRYHVDDKVFDSNDQRSGYRLVTHACGDEPPAKLVEAMDNALKIVEIQAGTRGEFYPVNGNGEKAMEVLATTGAVHMRTEGNA